MEFFRKLYKKESQHQGAERLFSFLSYKIGNFGLNLQSSVDIFESFYVVFTKICPCLYFNKNKYFLMLVL